MSLGNDFIPFFKKVNSIEGSGGLATSSTGTSEAESSDSGTTEKVINGDDISDTATEQAVEGNSKVVTEYEGNISETTEGNNNGDADSTETNGNKHGDSSSQAAKRNGNDDTEEGTGELQKHFDDYVPATGDETTDAGYDYPEKSASGKV